MKPIHIPLIALALSIAAHSHGQTLPKIWSPATKIEAHYGGGMMYYSYDILITDTLSYMKVLSNKGKKNYTRKFTPKDLNAILAFLATHRFDKIKSEMTGPTHDKASESISFRWEDQFFGASESSAMRVTDEYRDDFKAIQTYLEELFRKNK